ncbi:MAG TPA: undecaprenyl-diphosphate phosphatase [Candidatus Baltobacteraceae bacterium]|nr:undecaprenyl-diphosphate phosphatase [Candidatus Baltobacteraceae bacterium]
MTFVQAIALALLQGVSELFPVSSLGQTILIPAVLQWRNINRSDPTFLAFVTVLHLGTALALVLFYRRVWANVVRAFVASIVRGRIGNDPSEKLAWLLVVGTIPVGLLGVLLKDPVRAFFGSAETAAAFLILNAFVMFFGEYLRRRQKMRFHRADKKIEQLTWLQSAAIGVGQSLALFPGISRSGASMVAGLLADLNHEDAANYSFLLATPVILAASILEIPDLLGSGTHVVLVQAVIGGILAGIAAYASVAFLVRYFKNNDLRPFGWYCLVFGGVCLALAIMGDIR